MVKPYISLFGYRLIFPFNLVWHRDYNDRYVKLLFGKALIQLDNELPKQLDSILIPKMVYHRVITNSIILVKIKEL